MSRKREPHGGALNNSEYSVYVVMWLQYNPRLTSGKIRQRLFEKFGKDAAFSEPHIRAWMDNYYPHIVSAAVGETKEGSNVVGPMIASLTDSKLFGRVIDSLDYHQQMVQLLETKMKDVEVEYEVIKKLIADETTPSEDVPKLSRTSQQLRDQMIKFSNSIRAYKVYIDEWQRTHDFGERMGDLLISLTEASIEIFVPEIESDERKSIAIKEFKDEAMKIGNQYRVPADRIYT